jgi:F1F0 ATPase subunit 2
MSEIFIDVRSLMIGLGIGVIFFAGLWWTIRKGVQSEQPVFWFFGSLLARMMVVLAGSVYVAQFGWRSVLFYFSGLMFARLGITWVTRPRLAKVSLASGARHAP